MITFLPVVERELRIAARRSWTYWGRLGAAGASFVVATFMVLFWMVADTGGKGLFTTLSFFGLIVCLVDGIRTTADCLSEEKREGTLGLLFLTDLTGIDVVLGKLSSSALRSFYGLLSTFPILSLTLMMGGVTAGEFWAMVLALTAILLLSQSVAMWVSSVSWHERRAVSATIAVLVALVIVPLIPSWIALIPQSPAFWRVDVLSPYRLYLSAFGGGVTNPFFFKALLGNLLVALLFLALACWSVRRNWQSKPDGSRLSRSRRPVESPGATLRRQRMLRVNPVVWAALRDRRNWLWGLPVIYLAVQCVVFSVDPNGVIFAASVGAVIVNLVLKIQLAIQAARIGAEVRQDGQLELLLTTPLGERQIVAGLNQSLVQVFRGPILALFLVEVCSVIAGAMMLPQQREVFFAGFVSGILSVLYLLTLTLDIFAAGSLGLWLGFSTGKPARAAIRTIVLVLVVPWFVTVIPFLGMFAVLGLSAFFIGWGQSRLRAEFRNIATGQTGALGFGPPPIPGAAPAVAIKSAA